MSIPDDYLRLRKLQKAAREEMWHLFSHHPEWQKEWNETYSCFNELKAFVEWEPKQ